jgi:hypothetical protein
MTITVCVLDPAQASNVFLVLCIAIREHVASGPIGNKVELLGARGICGGFKRSAAWIGNGPRG